MQGIEYQVGDILEMNGMGRNTIIVKITSIADRVNKESRPIEIIKVYHYKVIKGKPNSFCFFESGCLLWTEHRIKKVPLLKAKLYE